MIYKYHCEADSTVLSLAIIEPPHAQSDKINASTHCGEFNNLRGHEMQKEHWGCKVKREIYIKTVTWTNRSTREEQRQRKASVPVSLGGVRHGGMQRHPIVRAAFSGDCCLLAVDSCCCGVLAYMSEHYK